MYFKFDLSFVVRRDFGSESFVLAAFDFGLQAAFFCGQARSRRNAWLAFDHRFANELHEALPGILPIALLSAIAPRLDDQDAVRGHSPAGELFQAMTHYNRQ